MGFRLGYFGAVIIASALLLAATPVSAEPAESQDDSLYSQFESLASRLKADSDRALEAASAATARAVEASKRAIVEIQADAGPRLETFRQTLNEQKAKLGIIGADAATRFDEWKQATTKSWSEMWSDAWTKSWSQSWVEIQRAAAETLDRFRDWIAKTPDNEEQTETPV